MKKFEEKMKECAAQVRKQNASDESMPFRFGEDVLNRLSKPEGVAVSTEGLWLRFGFRTLAGVSLALLLLISIPDPVETPGHLLPPHIEYSIVDSSGLL